MKKGYMTFGFFEEGKITFDCAGMSMERRKNKRKAVEIVKNIG